MNSEPLFSYQWSDVMCVPFLLQDARGMHSAPNDKLDHAENEVLARLLLIAMHHRTVSHTVLVISFPFFDINRTLPISPPFTVEPLSLPTLSHDTITVVSPASSSTPPPLHNRSFARSRVGSKERVAGGWVGRGGRVG
jgi:hypothetical protein